MHTVLLVDPSPSRDVLAERLGMQGYTVVATSDPARGAHLALSEPPSAVVADLWMPGISGIQLCRLLRSEPATETVPIILRGPGQSSRDRFWAERAGAVRFVPRGSMGDLVRALGAAIAAAPPQDGFFTQLAGSELDLRDRIAAQLDGALFDSVIAGEIRALGACGTFDRLFDLLSQFVVQVEGYRWLAVHTLRPERLGLHAHPALRLVAETEAREALGLSDDVALLRVEDEDAAFEGTGPAAVTATILLGSECLGRLALGATSPNGEHSGLAAQARSADLMRVIGRELGGPIRIATLMEESNRLAMVDSLTGLLNRRAFSGQLNRQLACLERHAEPCCALLLDVDRFKAINDGLGHSTGDAVLAELGRLLPQAVRRTDIVGRWGGEEFVLVLVSTGVEGAMKRAEAIRLAIETMLVRGPDGERVAVTASIGVAAAVSGDSVNSLIERADNAMYAAKTSGRNRVSLAGAPHPEPSSPEA